MATHSTRYTNSSANRAYNIAKASNSTSDIVLMPGEEFSYNTSTGPRSRSNGYKDAPVIVNGKVQDGSGGEYVKYLQLYIIQLFTQGLI